MKPRLLKLFLEKGFLVDRDVLDFLSELEDENIAKAQEIFYERVRKVSVAREGRL